ncbi:MAG: site-specific DNA-methyltransferase [Proteobacteria bacterium]|nr:site-specific DNA-methyltransferase [Desulfobacteraceae bacterium]MBU4014240.1 site-specific DNA-methyltransferase [Pseudomonadota bacterium]MBU4069238.1 site-specific DNA-methyltransferase [Pseudomonadota bacterium]MBU4126236.1 site-specific DNA-methyltransferase [Pseudomonadota bacterium]
MDKLKMQTPDLTDKNIEQIAALFPNVITETKDEKGNLRKAVDFDLLKQALSKNLVEADDERYRLDWPGKKASLLKANTPITKTLRPCREESVNFDTTENLYIEGDNFEVLKILQESYLGKVKMIDIDPPYNTGNDFIYKDDFKKGKEEYEEELGVEDEDGGKLFRNTDSNGRFHSDWLSMMYERLVVARDLLRDDGVIFISIDDNEVHNLRKICDEIFGEGNFIAQLIRKTIEGGKQDSGSVQSNQEYCLVYHGKDQSGTNRKLITDFGHYTKEDKFIHERGKYYLKPLENGGLGYVPSLDYPIIGPDGIEIFPGGSHGDNGYRWVWGKERYGKAVSLDLIAFIEARDGVGYKVYYKIYQYFNSDGDVVERSSPFGTLYLEGYTNRQAVLELKKIFDDKRLLDYPKPTSFLRECISMGCHKDSIIMDFFSGSATTAHAVMQQNAEDGGNRKFIMVQLPEKTDEKSEAYKAGYKTIAEIGKERIRRAGKKILSELEAKNRQLKLGEEPVDASKLDIGFRVYKTDSTNMKDVFYHPSKLKQMTLGDLLSNIKEDRTPEDLLTQVILDLGLELTLPIEIKKILGNTVFIVQTNALVACFDKNIDFKIVDTIADLKPFKVVFKDASFKDDKDRINVEERFKRLSPETKVMVI